MANPLFFGDPTKPLFGVYHAARGMSRSKARDNRAVLICPPIGQEYIRSHWCLRLLAKQLARTGIHVLRLDYHGIGDSSGTLEDIKSISDWTANIQTAIDHLKTTTQSPTVMLLGNRFGASLAAQVAQQRPDVNSLVLWEPVTCGCKYLDELRSMHIEMLDLWVCKMKTPCTTEIEELLGTRYPRTLIQSIESYTYRPTEIVQPQLVCGEQSLSDLVPQDTENLAKFMLDATSGGWSDLKQLETARLRPQTARSLVVTICDMFERLNRFDALSVNGSARPNLTTTSSAILPTPTNLEVR